MGCLENFLSFFFFFLIDSILLNMFVQSIYIQLEHTTHEAVLSAM